MNQSSEKFVWFIYVFVWNLIEKWGASVRKKLNKLSSQLVHKRWQKPNQLKPRNQKTSQTNRMIVNRSIGLYHHLYRQVHGHHGQYAKHGPTKNSYANSNFWIQKPVQTLSGCLMKAIQFRSCVGIGGKLLEISAQMSKYLIAFEIFFLLLLLFWNCSTIYWIGTNFQNAWH